MNKCDKCGNELYRPEHLAQLAEYRKMVILTLDGDDTRLSKYEVLARLLPDDEDKPDAGKRFTDWLADVNKVVWVIVLFFAALVGFLYLYEYANRAESWTISDSGNKARYDVATSYDGRYQSAVAYDGGIWYSTDYGVTWTQSDADDRQWQSVIVSGSGQYQTAGVTDNTSTNGTLWRSTDYGVTWTITDAAAACEQKGITK